MHFRFGDLRQRHTRSLEVMAFFVNFLRKIDTDAQHVIQSVQLVKTHLMMCVNDVCFYLF